jgi:hypothetical protein
MNDPRGAGRRADAAVRNRRCRWPPRRLRLPVPVAPLDAAASGIAKHIAAPSRAADCGEDRNSSCEARRVASRARTVMMGGVFV